MAGESDKPENTLSCANCGKPANLQCPKCMELKLPREGAAFCSQDCFKSSWSSHKSVHLKAKLSPPGTQNSDSLDEGWLYCLKRGQARTPKLPHFDWTGPLQPYPISSKRIVPDQIDKPDWAGDVKTPDQIERMRETCRIAREVLDAAARIIQPGVTTDEIDRVVHEATIAAVIDSLCRKLEDGDIVNVDVTVYYKGVHGDLNETYFVGNVDEESLQLVKCTYECLEKAISIVKPGIRFREIGEVINRHASMSGFSVVKSYCGHGIGELFHCAPNIPHYSRNKAVGVMKAGQTFTIEPMINAGVWRDRMWPDGWTAVTADGKRSAQFEHTLLTILIPNSGPKACQNTLRIAISTSQLNKKYTVMHEPYTEPTLMHVALQWTKAISQPRMVEPMDPINATGGTSGSRKCYWQNQPKVFSPV
ncbi:hypothetical protein JHK85_001754 [Glycine max]|nr:hypothetical protein JHK85_001754 [Glycine max]KAG5089101.1 hypothetical protein JHK86_001713 [Glycine max]